jgi:hypothetical protein
MTPQEENALKVSFLSRNPNIRDGIPAAVQHNHLYARISPQSKQEFHSFWRACLNNLVQKYEMQQSLITYLTDVFCLRKQMNDQFSDVFCETGFRLSHAQKSLSVLLKEKWCRNEIPAPPLCPIDRNVLNELGIHSFCWTRMDEVDFCQTVDLLCKRAQAQDLSIAQWELATFEDR